MCKEITEVINYNMFVWPIITKEDERRDDLYETWIADL